MNFNGYLSIKEEVLEALKKSMPVVALESTIISHGMPYPENMKTAIEVEKIIYDNGAIPATIAIIDGIIKIGLTHEEIEFLSKADNVVKASRRDIPIMLSKNMNAATTVSATMICASIANIKFFATGGIGGVHRHAETTFDISADLQELAKTKVAVISSGIKSILDLNLTMEYLETLGVPVLGYQTDELPGFYSRESGIKVNYRIDTPHEIADILMKKWDFGLDGGMLIANPIPEEYSMDKTYIDKAIEKALMEAENLGIKGKEITPFLLDKIKIITEGKSLISNIALIKNNALLASQIAVDYYENLHL
jgi:pseudouridine-5'-phosphate glycosidase